MQTTRLYLIFIATDILMNTYSLQGQAALVTGADSGIGKGVAMQLAKAGAKVIINHVDAHEIAEQTVDEIVAAGGEALHQAGAHAGGAARTGGAEVQAVAAGQVGEEV